MLDAGLPGCRLSMSMSSDWNILTPFSDLWSSPRQLFPFPSEETEQLLWARNAQISLTKHRALLEYIEVLPQ